MVPFFSVSPQSAILGTAKTDYVRTPALFAFAEESKPDVVEPAPMAIRVQDTRAARIDAYFARFDLPLTGYGELFVATAEKYDLDWRLLPAIAMRETTGGKFACYNNPFGWGSCKIRFESFTEAIDVVGLHLGGFHKNTDQYYKDKTTLEKLYYYNGTVIPSYPREVVRIMERIEIQELKTY